MPTYDPEALGARCSECSLRTVRVGGPVGPERHAGDMADVISETPGEKECNVGRPLVGPGGMEFTNTLTSIGVQRTQVALHHAIACAPPEGDLDKVMLRWQRANKKRVEEGEEPVPSPIDCCRPRLLADLRHPHVITLGKTALHALTGKARPVLDIRGGPMPGWFDTVGRFHEGERPVSVSGTKLKVMPTLHPGHVVKARRWARAFQTDLARAFRWFRGQLNWSDPVIVRDPTPMQLVGFLSRNLGQPIIFDVETTFDDPTVAKLKCIGLSTMTEAVVVHLLSIEGPNGALVGSHYRADDEVEIRRILREFFSDPSVLKVGHNAGYFDRMVIEQHFGVTPAPLLDTILLHRSVESELPHRLAYVGSVYTDVTSWKDAHTAKMATTDEELGVYCVFHGTMVQLADGTSMPIHEIVEKRLPVVVQSRAAETGTIVQKRVTGWFRNTVPGQTWKRIRLATTPPKARGLIATPEHEVHTPRGRVRAEDIHVGDPVFIDERTLSGEQFCAILGTLMGDSILVVSPTQRKNRFAAPRAALQGGHTTGSGFAQYKSHRLHGVIQLLPEQPQRPMSANGRDGVAKPFTPFRSSMLHQLASIQQFVMDEDGTRRLRVPALFAAGPIGLAWWFMDDGCLQKADGRFFKSDAIAISTQRYSLADVEAVRDCLEKRFGRIYLGQDKVLRFTPEAAHAFGEYIAPHLPPVARYKLPRDHVFPDYEPKAWESSNDFATAKVVSVEDYVPPREAKHQRIRADTRYCLEVEDTHNFMTADGLVQNCAIDCCVTARVLPPLAEAAKLRGQEQVVERDHRVQEVCVGMHQTGMLIDRQRVQEETRRVMEEMNLWRQRTLDASGRSEFNANSPLQIRSLIFDGWKMTPAEYTNSGDPSTADDSLRLMRTQNSGDKRFVAFVDALRRYRRAAKEFGTYLKRMVPYGQPVNGVRFESDGEQDEAARGLIMADGRVRPDYNAHGTTSGRLSSSNPNAQNWPKHLRGMVIAQPGCVLVGADADQLELRIITAVAQIAVYLEAFAQGKDPHAMTASLMFGKAFDSLEPKSDQWDKLRKIAKGIKYASFYGSGDETVHGLVTSAEDEQGNLMYPDLSVREISTLRRRWLDGIPELPRWWDDCLDEYRNSGFILDPVWLRRRDFLDGEKFNEIVNFPIQSAGSAIIHDSTFDLLKVIPFGKWGKGTGLIAQVHDALYVEAPCPHPQYEVPKLANGKPDEKQREFGWCPIGCTCEANWSAREIEKAMNRSIPGLDGVPFKAKAKIGARWSDV